LSEKPETLKTGRWEPSNLGAFVSEALEALGRFDADGLERMAFSCEEWMGAGDRVGSAVGQSDIGIAGSGEIPLFARVLETTMGNISIICQSRLMSAVQLEYVPGAGRQGRGALD
jgi:hypothetical protein